MKFSSNDLEQLAERLFNKIKVARKKNVKIAGDLWSRKMEKMPVFTETGIVRTLISLTSMYI